VRGSTCSAFVVAALTVVRPNTPLFGQTEQPAANAPAFEVASIKQNTSGNLEQHIVRSATGLSVTNMPVRQLILFGYVPLQPFQLLGGPSWIDRDRFDMTAKIEGIAPPPSLPGVGPDAFMVAMRALLADRFKLTLHHEQREMDIYAMVFSKPGSGPGVGLKQSTTDCEAFVQAATRGGVSWPAPGTPVCGLWGSPGQIRMGGSLSLLTNALSTITGRKVVDRTGLSGNWDLTLTFAAEQRGQPPGAEPPAADPTAPSIFTALQEQLGLKLESTKGLVDVLVIDRVEHPTPD
jgi:bla regulator protein blaR1